MLRKSEYAVLEELGLGHLADVQVTLHRHGGRLHRANPCPHLAALTVNCTPQAGPEESTTFTGTAREVDEAICTCTWQDPALQDLQDVKVLARNLRQFARKEIPAGRSYADLCQITDTLMAVTQTLDMFRFSRMYGKNPLVLKAADESRAQLERERDELCELLREHGGRPTREYAISQNLTTAGPLAERLEEALGSPAARELGTIWRSLVYRGYDRERRRRVMSKVAGGYCMGDVRVHGSEQEIREALTHLEAVLGILAELEDTLEERTTQTPQLRLATLEVRSHVYSTGLSQVAVEARTVARSSTMRLLLIPADSMENFQYTNLSGRVAVPDDPQLLDTVVKLWEGDGDSVFSDPSAVLEAAELL